MKRIRRSRVGRILFFGAVVIAVALYWLTRPDGLPWNEASYWALVWDGTIPAPPQMRHAIWAFFVRLVGGDPIALSALCAALAAGFLAALVNRYFGWRLAASAALAWIFWPSVWRDAVLGEFRMLWAFAALFALWAANAVVLLAFREKRTAAGALAACGSRRVNRYVAWGILGTSALFAVVSATNHSYRIGEAATVYARMVLERATGKWVVLVGMADAQIYREAGQDVVRFVELRRRDDAYRTNLVSRVRSAFPEEPQLVAAAQVGADSFVSALKRAHPDAVYVIGEDLEDWDVRWARMTDYLDVTDDPFVGAVRHIFAYEANTIANRMQDEGRDDEAWKLYWRIYQEIDNGNMSALLNMNGMIRRGCRVHSAEKERIVSELANVFKDQRRIAHLDRTLRGTGPVRIDPAERAMLRERLDRLSRERKEAAKEGGRPVPRAVKTLFEWNNEMVAAMDRGEYENAGRIARKILSNPRWRSFIPANAVLGGILAREGDYLSSEQFFRVALATTNTPPAAVLRDYAETLRHLKKFGDAEKYARQAVAGAGTRACGERIVLAEILIETGNDCSEAEKLLKDALKFATQEERLRIREIQKRIR